MIRRQVVGDRRDGRLEQGLAKGEHHEAADDQRGRHWGARQQP